MKPDAYMPFYGNDFFRAVHGQRDFIRVGYLLAIWYYWHHNNCAGLKDDDEFLRRICEVDQSDWDEAKAIIFDNDKFFTRDADDLWQQGRAQLEWTKSASKYTWRVKQTANARKKRWSKDNQ